MHNPSKESEVKRLTEEIKAAKEEKNKQAGAFICLKDEWKRAHYERSIFETEVASLRTRVAELEVERNRDI